MQKPTLWYTWVHTYLRTRLCIITPRASTTTCFWRLLLKVPTFQTIKNKRLVNALNMSAIPPSRICADTLAWDCHAKKSLPTPLQVQRYEKILIWTNLQTGFYEISLFLLQNRGKLGFNLHRIAEKEQRTDIRCRTNWRSKIVKYRVLNWSKL